MIGNIFYSFKEIDETGELFKSWIELTGPVWELMGTETTDLIGMKRWLAFLEGGLLPIISLTSLHFFVKYEKPEETTTVETKEVIEVEEEKSEEINLPKVKPEEIKKIRKRRNPQEPIDAQAELEKQMNEAIALEEKERVDKLYEKIKNKDGDR